MTQQLRCDVDEADMLNAAFWMTEVASASAMVMTAAEGDRDGGFTTLERRHCCCWHMRENKTHNALKRS